MDQMQLLGIGLGLAVVAVLLLIIFIKSHMILCQPNELVVITGRKRRLADGSTVGYRVVRGGRGFKFPLIESVARLPLTTQPIQVQITNAMCRGMIPVNIEGRASVKLAGSTEEGSEAGIERFLGKSADAVSKTAQQTIEGALRGVIATVAPEEANSERIRLAQEAAALARENLNQLGIVLDFLVITDVSDQSGYLEAIGRKRNSEVKRDAMIAEAIAEADAIKVASEQKQISREAEISAETEIVSQENGLAVHRAKLAASTNQVQEKAAVAGKIARVEEEIELESHRVQLSEKREEADTIIPARASREADQLRAEGTAAKILEDGRATAEAIKLMQEQWQDEESRDLFLIQLMPNLLDKVTSVISDNLRIDKLTILDGGSGEGLPAYVKNLTNSAVSMIEQIENATGVDLAKLAKRGDDRESAKLPKELG
jgi:flotillin